MTNDGLLKYQVTALCFYESPDGPFKKHDGIQGYLGVERTWFLEFENTEINDDVINETPDCDSIVDKGLDEAIALERNALETAPTMSYGTRELSCEYCVVQKAILLKNAVSPIVGENNNIYPKTHDDILKMVDNMERYGGGFVESLARCFIKADMINTQRLVVAFPDIVDRYFNWGKTKE